jgi:hypothetical protein
MTGTIIEKHLAITAVRKIISVPNGPLELINTHKLTPVFLEGL